MLFQDVYNLPFWKAVSAPYSGYYNVLTRLLAEACSPFPYSALPFLYTLLSLLGAAAAFSFFYLPHFRRIVSRDWQRFAICLFLCAAPNAFPLLRLETVHFYFAFFLVLVAVMDLPRRTVGKSAVLVVSGLCAWSSPTAIVLAPVFLYRSVRRGVLIADRIVMLVIFAAFLSYGAAVWHLGTPAHTDFRAIPAIYWHGFAFRVGAAGLIGHRLAEMLVSRFGWYGALPFLLLVVGLCATAVIVEWRRGSSVFAVLVLLWVIFSTVVLLSLRSDFAVDFFNFRSDFNYWLHDRYFYPATLTLFLLLGVLWSRTSRPTTLRIAVPGLCWACCLYFWGYTFYGWTNSGLPFAEAGKMIREAERQAAADGKIHKLYVPIAPQPWFVELDVGRRTPAGGRPQEVISSSLKFTDYFNLQAREPGDAAGLRRSQWFGAFDDSQYPWVKNTVYGWIEILRPSQGGFWMWSKSEGFFWTTAVHFPRAFSESQKTWIALSPLGERNTH